MPVPRGPIDTLASIVRMTAWWRTGDKPLSEPTMARLVNRYGDNDTYYAIILLSVSTSGHEQNGNFLDDYPKDISFNRCDLRNLIKFSLMMTSSNEKFPRYCPFVTEIQRSPVDPSHKDQCRRAMMFPLICAWTNGWANSRDAGDLRRHRGHYDVTVL